MKEKHSYQYTIRAVPEHLDTRVREVASRGGISLNAAVLDALRRGLGEGGGPVRYRDLSGLITAAKVDRKGWKEALREMDVVDEAAWR